MTEEDKKQKYSEVRKRFTVILLSLLVLMPSLFSVILMFQMMGLRKDVKELKNEVGIWDNQEAYVQAMQHGQNSEVSEEEATADVVALENKLVWDEMNQDTQKWSSGSGIRRVYLTFDDGPSSNTDKILDFLNEYGV